MAEVPKQGPIRLVHLDPQLLPMHIVAFGEIQCDDSVLVSGGHVLVRAGQ
ncbi:Uncharacterised protein [Mycobacterium tuberculosis]|uniref:Uncharacterized protein n=1 Tax=Mycobacterium tuberculosis TaxID=1773 RepID=A0A0T9F7R7_MYCTX|nr:Uncharacterised protein [Mycobacterium tuberculosis]CKU29533.1 Uncharacterised protein [Mycobacterium tuberculosis]CNU20271.1 Uncharacterised protein [Mycobacterium tuberculosis]CNU43149.1 Uncharacterised protein [Mycobacterium tuberculosis]COU91257.1 Uncharacterised protein [Mycobacterium tuberculosis]